MTLAYTTELTSEQYELLYSLLPPAATTGRPRRVNRDVRNTRNSLRLG